MQGHIQAKIQYQEWGVDVYAEFSCRICLKD